MLETALSAIPPKCNFQVSKIFLLLLYRALPEKSRSTAFRTFWRNHSMSEFLVYQRVYISTRLSWNPPKDIPGSIFINSVNPTVYYSSLWSVTEHLKNFHRTISMNKFPVNEIYFQVFVLQFPLDTYLPSVTFPMLIIYIFQLNLIFFPVLLH